MITLVGLGLIDQKDISLRGIEAIEGADRIFMENYTSRWKGEKGIKDLVKKEIETVERNELEEGSDKILSMAKEGNVVVLIPGDPLVATTHVELLIHAKKMGIQTEVVHSSSIYSAVAETGLQIYKFGKTTTIPIPQKNYRPVSPYEVIDENKEKGLHTLALLDIKERAMEVEEALRYLLEIEDEKEEDVVTREEKVVAFNIGPEGSTTAYKKIRNLLEEDFPTPAVLIFTGSLHEKEKEALEMFSI